MGIPKFFGRWLKKVSARFPGVLQKNIPENVSSLLIDANFIFHYCAQIVYGYGEFDNEERRQKIKDIEDSILEKDLFLTIGNKLLQIVENVKPRINLVIAVDGVTPFSKMIQQRARRIRAKTETVSNLKFNPNCITAGTDFMKRLDTYLTSWISKNAFMLPEKVIYSSHLVPGEGEMKIMELIRKGEINGNGAHILYGLDADLIMLSLISPLRDMFLMREDIVEVINIENLKMMIMKLLSTSSADPIMDFLIIMMFLGNDFIPPLSIFHFMDDMVFAVETLLEAYRKARISIFVNEKINKESLKLFFISLAEILRDKEFPLLTEEISEQLIQRKANKFIEGIFWVLNYYTKGPDHINRFWYYPYEFGPFADDLFRWKINESIEENVFLQTIEKEKNQNTEKNLENTEINLKNTEKDLKKTFNLTEYMLIVLPDKELLPNKNPNIRKYYRSFNKLLSQDIIPKSTVFEELKKLLETIKEEDKIKEESLVIIKRKLNDDKMIRKLQDLGIKFYTSKPRDRPVTYHK
jgi:5'-3' exonuclease